MSATTSPTRHVIHVGRARTSVTTPARNPSATLRRASTATRRDGTIDTELEPLPTRPAVRREIRPALWRGRREPPLDGGHHFVDVNIVDAQRRAPALALVMTLAS